MEPERQERLRKECEQRLRETVAQQRSEMEDRGAEPDAGAVVCGGGFELRR